MQEKIKYGDIMNLGFIEEEQDDEIYFNEYGYPYSIINKNLTDKIYLDWVKETQLCELVRMDSPKTCNIKKRVPIKDLGQLKKIINFFSDKKEEPEEELVDDSEIEELEKNVKKVDKNHFLIMAS